MSRRARPHTRIAKFLGRNSAPAEFRNSLGLGKVGKILASTAIPLDLVDVIASEMAVGVERAVECWMSQIEQVFADSHLTSLGRLNAVRGILEQYKHLTGKTQLERRKAC